MVVSLVGCISGLKTFSGTSSLERSLNKETLRRCLN